MSVAELKLQIKNWEHDFQKANNRLPLKSDIKQNPKVYTLYKSYRNAKSEVAAPKSRKNDSKGHNGSGVDQISIEINDDANEEIDPDSARLAAKNIYGELGPTPQANGKVLSIFDFRLTPPDSSPLKERLPKQPFNVEFKTPTKAVRIDNVGAVQQSSSISERLLAVAEDPETPTRGPSRVIKTLETPQYLAKNNRKFEFAISPTKNIAASPSSLQNTPVKRGFSADQSPAKSLKISNDDTPTKPKVQALTATELSTPVKPSPPLFSVSPSPLKTHRFMSKKLSDVFQDFKTIQEDKTTVVFSEHEEEDEEEEVTESQQAAPRKKKFTQKRTTRRWKIKPRSNDLEEDDLASKDIHKEIDKLYQADHEKLQAYIHSEEESEDTEDSEAEYVSKEPTDTKGMHKPKNNNFQRLKINDARAKAFKRRMRR